MERMRFKPHNCIDKNEWSVGIYVRLSDEDRDKKQKSDLSKSIQNQTEYIKRHIDYLNDDVVGDEKYKCRIFGVYTDDDYTGMSFEREGFKRMMNDVKANKIDCIIVKNLSRFGRYDSKVQDYLEREFEIPDKEVRLIAIGDNYDSLYKELGVIEKITIIFNREYSETQHKNVSVGMHGMQKDGKHVAAFAPYGYKKSPDDKNKLIVDETAAVIVRKIYDLYKSGISPKEIARLLTDEGYVSPSTYKKLHGSNFSCCNKINDDEKHWTSSSVKSILMNEMYTGTMVQHKQFKRKLIDKKPTPVPKKDWIRVPNTHEAIIQKDAWDDVQSMMSTIKRDLTKKDDVTIFKGILKCGDCGHAMRKKWDSYQKTTGSKEKMKYLYYNCGTFRDYGTPKETVSDNAPHCTSHYISDKVIRKVVLSDINMMIKQIQDIEKLIKEQEQSKSLGYIDVEKEISDKRKLISKYEKMKSIALQKLLTEVIDDNTYKATVIDLDATIECYEKEIDSLKTTVTRKEDILYNSWVTRLLELGKIEELDRATVVELIDKIYIYQDKRIEIVYKFDDEFDALFCQSVE